MLIQMLMMVRDAHMYFISSEITDELIPELSDKINEAGEKVKALM